MSKLQEPALSPNSSDQPSPLPLRRSDTIGLLAITAAVAVFHILTNSGYGFHRDELQFLSDARHLDWGFVSYPPFTPFIERIGMALFGLQRGGFGAD